METTSLTQACMHAHHLSFTDQAFFLFDHLVGEAREHCFNARYSTVSSACSELYCNLPKMSATLAICQGVQWEVGFPTISLLSSSGQHHSLALTGN